MAIIKSYTDLSQSKTLSKILPLESADMYYFDDNGGEPNFKVRNGITYYYDSDDCLSCWSLASLLDVLPEKYTKLLIKEGGMYRIIIKDLCMTSLFDNPIDACVVMIELLHELNLL